MERNLLAALATFAILVFLFLLVLTFPPINSGLAAKLINIFGTFLLLTVTGALIGQAIQKKSK